MRLAEVLVTFGNPLAMFASELRIFHQAVIILLVAKMKTLGYDVAEVLAMQRAFAFQVVLDG